MLATTCLRSALIASAQCCDPRLNSFSATGKCLPNVGVWEELFCECNALLFIVLLILYLHPVEVWQKKEIILI